MKRMILLITGIAIALVVAGCSSDGNDGGDNDPVNYTPATDVLEKIENEDTFAFVFGDEECPACQSYLGDGLKGMDEKNDVKLDYVELNGIEDKEQEFEDIQVILSEHLDGQFEATPTTYFMVEGQLEGIIVGAVSHDELLEDYEKYIK